MSFIINGLRPEEFQPLFDLDEDALAARGIIRKIADAKPGYPCRVTLEDAEPGERVLLLNHVSHKVATPYRLAYAIYIREGARRAARYVDEIPPALSGRPIALRIFSADAMLVGADMATDADRLRSAIDRIFDDPGAAYIHAHNAMHGCFAAEIRRGAE
jgi:hypothetical protein